MNIVALTRGKQLVENSIKQLEEEYLARRGALHIQLQELQEGIGVLAAGLDLDQIRTAEEVLTIRGNWAYCEAVNDQYHDEENQQVGRGVVRDAINDIANGCGKLKKKAIGFKIYSGFGPQRCDCEYGYGPRHGSVVFAVHLVEKYRKDEVLTEEQASACIYYLMNLKKIGQARAAGTNKKVTA